MGRQHRDSILKSQFYVCPLRTYSLFANIKRFVRSLKCELAILEMTLHVFLTFCLVIKQHNTTTFQYKWKCQRTMWSIFISVNELTGMTCLHLIFFLFVLFACSVIHTNMHFLQVKSPGLTLKPFVPIPYEFLLLQYLKNFRHRLRNTQGKYIRP